MSNCKCKKKAIGAAAVGATMPQMNEPDWGMLAATIGGGAASNVVVNSIVNTVFPDKPREKKEEYAGYGKILIGLGVVLYSPNEYAAAAGLGILVDGGATMLRAKVPQLSTIAMLSDGSGGVGVGEVIDLSVEDWSEINGTESDYAVGYAQEYAVSGGVN